MSDLLHRLDSFLAAHDGVITSAEAARLGIGPNDLRRLTRDGRLTRVLRGAYRQAAVDRDEQARRTVIAVMRASPQAVAASHQSGSLSTRTHDAFTVHRCPGVPDAFGLVDGQPVVAPSLAIIGTAIDAGVEAGVGAADAAMRRGMVSRLDLRTRLEQLRHTPGLGAARHAVALASPTAESPAESKARLGLIALGYRVIPQCVLREVDGRVVARVDFLLPDLGVVVEVDGAVKYAGADGREGLVREKWREDAIRRLGYGVARLVWSDLGQLDRIRMLVERARRSATQSQGQIEAVVRAHQDRTGATWDAGVLHSCGAEVPVS